MNTLWNEQEFDVMTQKRRGDAIQMIGSVWAPTKTLAAFYAQATYDEERWHLMYVVERADEIPVVRGGQDLLTKRGTHDGTSTR